jgi:hypothetical protein
VQTDRQQLDRWETFGILYLVVPLFVFFAGFIRFELAIAGCALIAWLSYELIRHTAWRRRSSSRWRPAYFLAIAGLWIWLSGGIGPVHPNGDWSKHYAIVNFLTQHPWPPSQHFAELGESAVRYYLGWYLVPSLLLKATSAGWQAFAMAAWSTLGVFLFFNLLPGIVGERRAAVLAPLVFIMFGGADLLGTLLSGYHHPVPYHFEWWIQWIQFSSNTTAIFWVPQHAIPAWLGAALLMRAREHDALLRYCALLLVAALLWSPFSALGLLPFMIALSWRHGLRAIALNWRAIGSGVLLGLPVAIYLHAGSAAIPHGYIGTLPCIAPESCFTFPSYVLFILVEVALPLAVLLVHNKSAQGFLVAAAITLCVIPFYKIGWLNDFAMRASLPALAIVAILCAQLLADGSKVLVAALIVVLLLGLPTTVGEIARGFMPQPEISPDTDFATIEYRKELLSQYFAPLPIWILR